MKKFLWCSSQSTFLKVGCEKVLLVVSEVNKSKIRVENNKRFELGWESKLTKFACNGHNIFFCFLAYQLKRTIFTSSSLTHSTSSICSSGRKMQQKILISAIFFLLFKCCFLRLDVQNALTPHLHLRPVE